MTTTTLCRQCGSETPNPKFCSRSCAVTFNNTRSPKKKPSSKTCPNCDTVFAGEGKYCTSECYEVHRRQVLDERVESGEASKDAVKRYLLKRDPTCQECGHGGVWNGKPLSLQMDHINGDKGDNTLENVRLLCPNCHSQTDTYCFKNHGNPLGKDVRDRRYVRDIEAALKRVS